MDKNQQSFPKVSIIMPVYNKQEYIQDCLNTILSQSLKDIEVICVDDGSTDSSLKIIEEHQLRDNRIVLLHQENQGAGPARNAGIKAAKGEYVAFMDPDDWYPDNQVLEDLYSVASKHKANICGGSLAEYVDGNLRTSYPDERQKYIFKKDELIEYANYQYDYGYHRFLYRRDFILENNLSFPAYRRFQDPPFFVKAMIYSGTFWALSRISYVYRVAYKTVNWDAEKLGHLANGLSDVISAAAAADLKTLSSLEVSRINKSYLRLFFEAMEWEICPEEYLDSLKALLCAIKKLDSSEIIDYVILALSNLVTSLEALDACCGTEERSYVEEVSPLVSVIVPVYNDEKYLESCVNSVLNQTLCEIEIIIVNDGSTDGSLKLAEQIMEGDKRVSIVSKENGGLSSARNAGLAVARGKYIQFLDSDDLLMPQALEMLYQEAESKQLDQLFFSAISFFVSYECLLNNKSYLTYYDYPSFEIADSICHSGQELFCFLSENNEFKPSACLQLIRKEFLDENAIDFYPGILHEDNLFTLECLSLAKRSAVTPQKLYLRRVHDASIMTSSQGVRNSYGYYKTIFEIIKFISSRNINLNSQFEKCLIDRLEVYIRQAGRLYGLSDNRTAMEYMQKLPIEESLFCQSLAQCYLKIKGLEKESNKLLLDTQTKLSKVQSELNKKKKELKTTQINLKRLKASNSWKIGRIATAPIRVIKRLFRKNKDHKRG